jgi:hypothetical protein
MQPLFHISTASMITTNNRYHQRLCIEAWHINMSNHALNKDDRAYLPEEYMHLIGRWRRKFFPRRQSDPSEMVGLLLRLCPKAYCTAATE